MKPSAAALKAMKGKEKISMLTCYDYSFAKAMNGKVDILLVGDSLGNVILGYERTRKVSMQDMIRHVEAVSRGAPDTFIVGDLPFGSYDNKDDAISNAKKLIAGGADAVKPEGKIDIVKALCDEGIPVMGHLGLLPQTAEKMGVVGRSEEEATKLLEDAKNIEKAGAFSLVLETVPTDLAKKTSEAVSIPTIGIGAGKDTDGQVLVSYDMLGMYDDFSPKFVRTYANIKKKIIEAVSEYSLDVKRGNFPNDEESFQ